MENFDDAKSIDNVNYFREDETYLEFLAGQFNKLETSEEFLNALIELHKDIGTGILENVLDELIHNLKDKEEYGCS